MVRFRGTNGPAVRGGGGVLLVAPLVEFLICMRSGTFADFFPKTGFFVGFSLYIINFAGRINRAAMGGAGRCAPRVAF